MLDFVLVLVVLLMSALALLYGAGCQELWNSDRTREAGPEGHNTPEL